MLITKLDALPIVHCRPSILRHNRWLLFFVLAIGVLGRPDLLVAQSVPNVENRNPQPIVIKNALVKLVETVGVPVEQSGVLVQLLVKEGQSVSQGESIARINSDALELNLEKARLEHELAKMNAEGDVDVQYSKKAFDVATSDLRRSEGANARVPNSVPLARLEKQKLERDRTELKLEQAKRDSRIALFKTHLTSHEIKLAKAELEKAETTSPITGLVVAVDKRIGEWVEASDVVCKIARMDRLQVEGSVPAEQAHRIASGTPVVVRFAYNWLQQKEFEGVIVFVSPESNPVNLNVQIRAEIPNTGAGLSAGLRGDILIYSPTR